VKISEETSLKLHRKLDTLHMTTLKLVMNVVGEL